MSAAAAAATPSPSMDAAAAATKEAAAADKAHDSTHPSKGSSSSLDLGDKKLAEMRISYAQSTLSEQDVEADPMAQFARWMRDAVAAKMMEPNAMTLATATPQGRPSARVVLLKEVNDKGFVFYTNYEGRKGGELEANPFAALTFWWDALHRQIRIEGRVERVPAAESDAYFASRPRESQIGAVASHQSHEVSGRAQLDKQVREAEEKYRDGKVPRPFNWGGFVVIPDSIEFWQGRTGRVHDRLLYRLGGKGTSDTKPAASSSSAASQPAATAGASGAAGGASGLSWQIVRLSP